MAHKTSLTSGATPKQLPSHVRHGDGIDKKLRKLRVLLADHDRRCWEIGDLCAELITRHRMRLKNVAVAVGYSKARLSELHLTARAFPPEQRGEGTFYDALMARSVCRRLPRLQMPLVAVRREITNLRGKRPRQIRAHFVEKLIVQDQNATLARSAAPRNGSSLINAPHHGDWRKVVPQVPTNSVKLFICDPPFGGYTWRPAGGYQSGRGDTNGLRSESDNNTAEEALAVTLPLFEASLTKLAPGGCMLLFQPGGKPDRAELLAETAKQGWDCLYALVWEKGTCAPSDCAYPYAPSSERILVFTRKGDRLEWHEQGLSRSDVLRFDSVTQQATARMERGSLAFRSIHMFQKPAGLCEFLVRKHTHPGDLVVEPFGCSGSGCVAAKQLGRRWVYIESNPDNFNWGRSRVAAATLPLAG